MVSPKLKAVILFALLAIASIFTFYSLFGGSSSSNKNEKSSNSKVSQKDASNPKSHTDSSNAKTFISTAPESNPININDNFRKNESDKSTESKAHYEENNSISKPAALPSNNGNKDSETTIVSEKNEKPNHDNVELKETADVTGEDAKLLANQVSDSESIESSDTDSSSESGAQSLESIEDLKSIALKVDEELAIVMENLFCKDIKPHFFKVTRNLLKLDLGGVSDKVASALSKQCKKSARERRDKRRKVREDFKLKKEDLLKEFDKNIIEKPEESGDSTKKKTVAFMLD